MVTVFEGRIRLLNGWDFEKGDFLGYLTKIGFSNELKSKCMEFHPTFFYLFHLMYVIAGPQRKQMKCRS